MLHQQLERVKSPQAETEGRPSRVRDAGAGAHIALTPHPHAHMARGGGGFRGRRCCSRSQAVPLHAPSGGQPASQCGQLDCSLSPSLSCPFSSSFSHPSLSLPLPLLQSLLSLPPASAASSLLLCSSLLLWSRLLAHHGFGTHPVPINLQRPFVLRQSQGPARSHPHCSRWLPHLAVDDCVRLPGTPVHMGNHRLGTEAVSQAPSSEAEQLDFLREEQPVCAAAEEGFAEGQGRAEAADDGLTATRRAWPSSLLGWAGH